MLLNTKLLTRRLKLEIQGADLTDSYLQTGIHKLLVKNRNREENAIIFKATLQLSLEKEISSQQIAVQRIVKRL